MKTNKRFITWLGLIIIILPVQAFSWFDSGHMLTAQIAYQQLDENVRIEIDSLIAELKNIPPDYATFVQAAAWMDGIKGAGLDYFSEFHYINQYHMTGNVSNMPPFENKNVIWFIHKSIDTLTNPKASRFAKGLALRFLVHAVADVHQPLHASSLVSPVHPNGNRGGNDFKIQPTGPGAFTNLHLLWDSGVLFFPEIHPDTVNYTLLLQETINNIMNSTDIETLRPQLLIDDPWAWAQESFDTAVKFAYTNLEEGDLPSPKYITDGQNEIKKRIILGGYRLANLLNKIFKETNSHPL